MLAKRYPYYLANRPVQPNADLEVRDKYSGRIATRVVAIDENGEERRALAFRGLAAHRHADRHASVFRKTDRGRLEVVAGGFRRIGDGGGDIDFRR